MKSHDWCIQRTCSCKLQPLQAMQVLWHFNYKRLIKFILFNSNYKVHPTPTDNDKNMTIDIVTLILWLAFLVYLVYVYFRRTSARFACQPHRSLASGLTYAPFSPTIDHSKFTKTGLRICEVFRSSYIILVFVYRHKSYPR